MKIFFSIIDFQKEKANTLLVIHIVKSLQIEVHGTNLILYYAGINVQSPQSATTPVS